MTKAGKTELKENEQNEEGGEIKSVSNASPWVSFLFKGILRGFVSAPLTFHISNFSIAISLDSIIWEITGFFLDKCKKGEQGEKKEDNDVQLTEEKEDSEVQDSESKKSQSSEENDN